MVYASILKIDFLIYVSSYAALVQLVERLLAKQKATGPSPVCCSIFTKVKILLFISLSLAESIVVRQYGGYRQVVKAEDCDSSMRGFDPHYLPQRCLKV